MRILVNDIAASNGGALSVLSEFYRFISTDSNAKEIEWLFVLNDRYFKETSNIKLKIVPKSRLNWIKRLWFDNYLINKICKEHKVDGVISMQNTASFTCELPQMVYMHQIIPFQKEKVFSFFKKNEIIYAIYQHIIGKLIKRSMKVANLIVVQAEWIKKLVADQTGVQENNIIVNGLDCSSSSSYEYNNDSNLKSNKFFYPAFECIYKNQDVIRQACSILEKKGIPADIVLTVEQNNNDSKLIKNIGQISHDAVMELMSESVLIFPSYVETVGLPLIEAMSVNALILAADCEFAHETLGDYPNAYYFDPFDSVQLSDLMTKIVSGEISKKDFIYVPKKRSNWDNVISSFVNYIHKDKHSAYVN